MLCIITKVIINSESSMGLYHGSTLAKVSLL